MRCPSMQPDCIRTFGANYSNHNFWANKGMNSRKLDDIDPRSFIYADSWNRTFGSKEYQA